MKQILLSTFFLLSVFFAQAQKLYVVSIGINDYADSGVPDLHSCESDVQNFNEVIRRHTSEVHTLLGSQATHSNCVSLIKRIFKQARPEDAVLLYFSGHGYPGGFCCQDISSRSIANGLSYTELQGIFKSCKATRKMVFADACFSGGLRGKKSNKTETDAVRKSDVMLFLSSRTNETSIETRASGQFTRFLVRGLGGGADANRDRIITAKELYDFVHEGVIAATHNKQHPVMWGSFNNTMIILNWNK